MHIEAEKLKARLQQATSKSISVSELAELVHICRSIAQAHFESHRQSILRVSLQHGLTLTDLAYDCIAEMFARSADGSFSQIMNFVNSLRNPLCELPAIEVFIAFRSFVIRVADAQIARLYAQADPVGSRIHRNIRENLKKSDALKLDRDFRGMVVRPSCEDSLDQKQPFPFDRLERTLLERIDHEPAIPHVLQCLRDILCSQTEFRRSIPLFDLVHILKKSIGDSYEWTIDEHEHTDNEGLSHEEIDRIRSAVEVALKEKILLTYLARGKIDRRQAEAMAGAFHDLLWDWCFGDDLKSLYDYLRLYSPMNENEYENTLRTKMEYLLKLARDEFAARLVKEL